MNFADLENTKRHAAYLADLERFIAYSDYRAEGYNYIPLQIQRRETGYYTDKQKEPFATVQIPLEICLQLCQTEREKTKTAMRNLGVVFPGDQKPPIVEQG